MKKSISWLCAAAVTAMLALMPTGTGADWTAYTEGYPSHVVLSHAFPSNEEYEWTIDFSGRTSAANDWLVRNIGAGVLDTGFDSIPGGGFGVTRDQAYQAIVGSTNGTALEAWSDIAYMYADQYDPASVDPLSRNSEAACRRSGSCRAVPAPGKLGRQPPRGKDSLVQPSLFSG